jgi:hypothetical protein
MSSFNVLYLLGEVPGLGCDVGKNDGIRLYFGSIPFSLGSGVTSY